MGGISWFLWELGLILACSVLSAEGIPAARITGADPAATRPLHLQPVNPAEPGVAQPCRFEGEYIRYYESHPFRYTRTYTSRSIHCEDNNLFLGEEEDDRKRLIPVSELRFEVEGSALGILFEVSEGVVQGLRFTYNGLPEGPLFTYRQPIKAHDQAVKSLATEFLKQAAGGILSEDMFTSEYASELFPDQAREVGERIRRLDKSDRFEIYKRHEDEDGLQYAFLMVCGEQPVLLHLRITLDLRIRWVWLDTGTEDDATTRARAMQFLRDAAEGTLRTDLVELVDADGHLSERTRTLLSQLKLLGNPIAIHRTKRPGVRISYFVVFQNGSRTLDLWMTEQGRVSGFSLE